MLKDLQYGDSNLYPEAEAVITDPDHRQVVSKMSVLSGGNNRYDENANLQGIVILTDKLQAQLADRKKNAPDGEAEDIAELMRAIDGYNWHARRLVAGLPYSNDEVRHAS